MHRYCLVGAKCSLRILQLAGEALVFFFVVRAVIACILSLFTFDWIEAAGTASVKPPWILTHRQLLTVENIGFWPDGSHPIFFHPIDYSLLCQRKANSKTDGYLWSTKKAFNRRFNHWWNVI